MLEVAVSLGGDAGHTAPNLNSEKTRGIPACFLFVCVLLATLKIKGTGKGKEQSRYLPSRPPHPIEKVLIQQEVNTSFSPTL